MNFNFLKKENNNNSNQNNLPNQNINLNNNDNGSINPIMYKNENDMSKITYIRALYVIIAILVIAVVILILKKRPITSTAKENELTKDLTNYKEVITKLGVESYYKAKDIYGDFILDTSRICGTMDTSTLIDNYYMKSTNPKFTTYTDLINYVRTYFYGNIVNNLVTSTDFKNYQGHLYCSSKHRNKNTRYINLESITLDNFALDKLEYTVKEKYFSDTEDINCTENCNYIYKENKFIIEKKDNRWLVTEFTIPY